MGYIKDDLQTMQRGRKRRNDQSAFGLFEYLLKRRNDRHFRRCASRHGRVCRVAEQSEHTFIADSAQCFEIVWLADDRRVVDLIIACVDDRPDRRMDGERETLDQRMRRMDKLNFKI